MKKGMTFEQAMARLEEVVTTLEQEKLPLEESLKLVAESTELMTFCNKQLDDAELRIEKLHEQVQSVLDGDMDE